MCACVRVYSNKLKVYALLTNKPRLAILFQKTQEAAVNCVSSAALMLPRIRKEQTWMVILTEHAPFLYFPFFSPSVEHVK